MTEHVETVIVGAGQAGLAMSYWLTAAGREHIILERGRVGERWRSERWDSLTILIPNWTVSLPGKAYAGADPDGLMGKDEVVDFIEGYASQLHAPVRAGVNVNSLRHVAASECFRLESDAVEFEASNVVAATGPFQQPNIPVCGTTLSAEVFQVHSSGYRNPEQLPPGAVMVVGSGSSGQQIAEELLAAGRRVYISVGDHRRAHRRYCGRDSAWWKQKLGNWDRIPARKPRTPCLTGVDGGHDLDLRRMASDGLVLLGHLRGGQDTTVQFSPDLAETMAAADAELAVRMADIESYIDREGLEVPPDSSKAPWPDPKELTDPILTLDLHAAGVTVVVWATGFRFDFEWIHLPVFNEDDGRPTHQRGVTTCPGMYFLVLEGLYKITSSFIMGVGEDAAYLAEHITSRHLR